MTGFGVHGKKRVNRAGAFALNAGFAKKGDRLVLTAGVPFGTPGSTNTLRVAWVE